MSKKKKKDTAYRKAVSGAKGLLRVLIYICVILVIIFAGRTAYSFGYLVFDQHPMAATQEEGQDVTVVVKEEESVYQVGETLEEKGLIEHPTIFWVQELLSDHHGEIKPGTYLLNTHQNANEMLKILIGENTEGQPVAEEEPAESGKDTSDTKEAGTDSGEE